MEGLLQDLKRCGVLNSNKVYDAMKQSRSFRFHKIQRLR